MKKVSIVVPCYNEAQDIAKKSEVVKDYLKNNKDYHFDVVLVNDGSKDNTEEVIKSIEGVHAVSYHPNGGKGHAVREGLRYSVDTLDSDYILFMDADLSTDLSAVEKCLSLLEEGNDFVLGSRHDKESDIRIKQPFKRRFISKCSRIIIKSMFHFKKIKDTQCGFKGMKKEVAKILVDKSKMDGFSFDVEYLYIVKLRQFSYISFPVIWSDDRGSTVSPLRSSVRFFKDLFKIKRNKKHYLKDE